MPKSAVAVIGASRDPASVGGAIAELDINPLIVHPQGQGAQVADARVLLAES